MESDIEWYKEKVKKAKEIVESLKLEEPFKTNTFNTLLKSLLDKDKIVKTPSIKSNLVKEEEEIKDFDFSKVPYFENFDKLSWKSKLLCILKWAKQNHPKKGLISSEFASIFNERFGMAYIDTGTVNKELSRRLLNTPLITRKKINKKEFRWFITPKGEEAIF